MEKQIETEARKICLDHDADPDWGSPPFWQTAWILDQAAAKVTSSENRTAQEAMLNSNQSIGAEMPRYRSHKVVHALKIIRYGSERGSAGSAHRPGGEFNWYMFEDKSVRSIKMDDPMLARYSPTVGDYLVVYADGYESFSPGAAFEEGYTRVEG